MPFKANDAPGLKLILEELNTQSDRGSGIIGAAIVEDVLTDLLQNRLIGGSSQMERLFSYEKNGPLSQFSGKIEIAYSVGLIGMAKRTDLHAVRRIRNRFAHNLEPIDFSDAEIVAWCNALKRYDKNIDQPRGMFLTAVVHLSWGLMLTLEKFNKPITEVMSDISEDELERALLDSMGDWLQGLINRDSATTSFPK